MNYQLMVEDVIAVIRHLEFIQRMVNWSFYGENCHENLRTLPRISRKLIVIDMSPMPYEGFGHKDVFNGLFAVKM